jgi:hypothetical protein
MMITYDNGFRPIRDTRIWRRALKSYMNKSNDFHTRESTDFFVRVNEYFINRSNQETTDNTRSHRHTLSVLNSINTNYRHYRGRNQGLYFDMTNFRLRIPHSRDGKACTQIMHCIRHLSTNDYEWMQEHYNGLLLFNEWMNGE